MCGAGATDVHSHIVPATFARRRSRNASRPLLDVGPDDGQVYVQGRHFRTVPRSCWDLNRRLDDVRERGVHRQVLSPMPELFSYWAAPGESIDLCRETNDWLAAAVANSGGTFEAFGIVPLQAPDAAAEMLRDLVGAGLRGVEVGSHVNGTPLHDDRFGSFFAEAARLGLVVFVHAFHPRDADQFSRPGAANGVLFPLEVGRALGGLITEGTIERHPAIRILASHGGGGLTTVLPRLDFLWRTTEALGEHLHEAPSLLARRLHVDSLVYSDAVLQLVMSTLGEDAVVFGTDFPFLDHPPILEERLAARLDATARRLLCPPDELSHRAG